MPRAPAGTNLDRLVAPPKLPRMSWRKFTKDGENFGIPWDAKKFNFYKALKTIKKTVTHINCLILHLDETFLRARLLRNRPGHVC
jgi:hypothetical protein